VLRYSRSVRSDRPRVKATLIAGDAKTDIDIDVRKYTPEFLNRLDERVPLPRASIDTWWDDETGGQLDADEVIQRYAPELRQAPPTVYEKLAPYVRSDGASLIETQRLIRTGGFSSRVPARVRMRQSRSATTVALFSEELATQLGERFADSGRIGQQLDRTFASRVLKRTPPTIDEETVRAAYSEQLEFRERLVQIGIADPAPEVLLPTDALLEPELRLMEEYLEDSRKKLEVFADILSKVELMQDIIRDKFLYKRFSITRDGFKVESEEPKPRPIPLSTLSSGEQHELVLVYSLLFETAAQSIVMIDEPELSLHVRWQRRFLSDLTQIAKLTAVRFLVATHSPQIIDEWWDATTELDTGWR